MTEDEDAIEAVGTASFGKVADANRRIVAWTRLANTAPDVHDRQISRWQADAAAKIRNDALTDWSGARPDQFTYIANRRIDEWRRLSREAPTEQERERNRWHAAAGEMILTDLLDAVAETLAGIRDRSRELG